MDINNLLTRSIGNMFSGIGTTILGNTSGKYNFNYDWTPLNVRTVWVDTSYNELLSVAQNVPHLNIVISRGAELFSQMKIRHVDSKGKDIQNSPILKFLRKPWVIRNQQQWLYDFYVYNAIYNNVFMFPMRGLPSAFPSAISILPSGLMKANLTGKVYRQTKLERIIESWNLLGDDNDFKPEEIVHITEGITMNGIIGASKITSLQLPLSNIMAALKSNNIILTERGMIGFIVTDPKDANGSLPLSSTMKKVVNETYQKKNSLDSRESHVGLFTSETKWVPMSFDMKQLMLIEGLEDAFCNILGAYGIDRDIFPSIKGATFENKAAGLRNTIQGTLQPLGEKLLSKLATDIFMIVDNGEELIPDFSGMPIMQEDKLTQGQAYNQTVLANSLLFHDNIIDGKTYAENCEVPMTGTGEVPVVAAPIAPPALPIPKEPK